MYEATLLLGGNSHFPALIKREDSVSRQATLLLPLALYFLRQEGEHTHTDTHTHTHTQVGKMLHNTVLETIKKIEQYKKIKERKL